MAELLGTIASGAGIFALAVQLGDSIKKLSQFWDNYKDAPHDMRCTTDELEILSLVVEDISENYANQQHLSPRMKNIINKAIQRCEAAAQRLKILVESLERAFPIGRKRAALRVAFKRGEIEKFRGDLEAAKLGLMLANQCYYHAIRSRDFAAQKRLLEQIDVSIQTNLSSSRSNYNETVTLRDHAALQEDNFEDQCCKQQDSSHSSTVGLLGHQRDSTLKPSIAIFGRRSCGGFSSQMTKGLFGTLWYQTTTKITRKTYSNTDECSCSISEEEFRVVLQLPTWFFSRQYDIQLRKSQQGWDSRLRSYNIVPKTAPIFKYCVNGDVDGLRILFESGHASPYDVDVDGITPLHYAANSLQADICKFLLAHDANIQAVTATKTAGGQLWRPRDIRNHDKLISEGGFGSLSTPLSLLISRGHVLGQYGYSSDFEATVRILVEDGQYDISNPSLNGFTLIQNYWGPTSLFHWLRRQTITPIIDLDGDLDQSMEALRQRSRGTWDNTAEILQEMFPNGHPDSKVAKYQFESGETLLWLIAKAWLRERFYRPVPGLGIYESLIKDLIVAGADIHACHKVYNEINAHATIHTLFLGLMNDLIQHMKIPLKSVRFHMRYWLKILSQCQVSLKSFWDAEFKIYDTDGVSWILGDEAGYYGYYYHPRNYKVQILSIYSGKNAEDFDVVFEDTYVSGKFLPSFWETIAREGGKDEETLKMPGGWEHGW